jgi:hypothetical protein
MIGNDIDDPGTLPAEEQLARARRLIAQLIAPLRRSESERGNLARRLAQAEEGTTRAEARNATGAEEWPIA